MYGQTAKIMQRSAGTERVLYIDGLKVNGRPHPVCISPNPVSEEPFIVHPLEVVDVIKASLAGESSAYALIGKKTLHEYFTNDIARYVASDLEEEVGKEMARHNDLLTRILIHPNFSVANPSQPSDRPLAP